MEQPLEELSDPYEHERHMFMTPGTLVLLFVIPLMIFPLVIYGYFFAIQIPFFYYADFRNIESKVEQVPNVTIVDSWKHEDLTLEDFGFELSIPDCPPVHIGFHENHVWHGLFYGIEGIVVSGPGFTHTKYAIDDINAGGLNIRDLEDLLEQMPKAIERFNALPGTPTQWPEPKGHWVYIRLDE